MTVSTNAYVLWEGRTYFGARELGFTETGGFVISLWTTPPPDPRGSYFTCPPVSPTAYRAERPTKCAIRRDEPKKLTLIDDWGMPHRIGAPADVLDAIEREAAAHNVPNISAVDLSP